MCVVIMYLGSELLVLRVMIRVDSSSLVGSGHLMRCLTLAERLRQERGAEAVFISRDLHGNLSAFVSKRGFELALLPRVENDASLTGYAAWLTVSQKHDAEETLAVIGSQANFFDLLIVDSYAIDSRWESMLRPHVGRIFVIDDLANRQHDCDVLLDQNFYLHGEHRYDGLVPEKCRLLLGPRYALLRKEFYVAKARQNIHEGKLLRALVFYGGSDLTDETSKAVRALMKMRSELPTDFKATVIVGSSNVRCEAVRELCAGENWLEYHCQVDNMADYMADSDLMLGAGGTTTWERCCLCLPALVTAVADNQLPSCAECAEAGLQQYLGRVAEVTEEVIIDAIRSLTKEKLLSMSKAGVRLMAENCGSMKMYLGDN